MRLSQWAPPKPPEHVVAFAYQNSLRLQWDTVTEDVFGRPLVDVSYKVYGQETPFVDRQIGRQIGSASVNHFDFGLPFPYQIQYFRVTACANDMATGN